MNLWLLNEGPFADEQGEHDDWIELYNNGNHAIDVGGLFITDNFNNPTKWRIPRTNTATTVIAPKGYLILWADNDPEQGLLHCDFKLSSKGEEVALVQASPFGTIILDSISYGIQSETRTFGQFEDGMGNWQYMTPTPHATNKLSGVIDRIEPSKSSLRLYPNPVNINLTIRVNPTLNDFSGYYVDVRDINGKVVIPSQFKNQTLFSINVGYLLKGVYHITLTNKKTRLTGRFIKL